LKRLFFLSCTIIVLASIGLADQSGGTTNIFKPESTPARTISGYSILVLAICAAIFVIVAALLAYIMIRFRRRQGDDNSEPPQIYGSNQIELAWTVLPIIIVFVLSLVTARTIADVQNKKAPEKAMQVVVVGHQWWWEIRYPEYGIVTANELHVPASENGEENPTYLKLESADVAHSFWVPQLAGKTDVIPNRENRMWIEPTKPGTYLGNCAEYCGTQHAKMMLRVIVHPRAEFEQWVTAQKAAAASDAQVKAGQTIFLSTSCVNCHTVNGTTANGKFGPDLTHLMSRDTLGSGAALNNPEKLRQWVRDPQELKEGCYMPDMQLTDEELNQLVAYLLTLR
jgi:cytochrome c oxidase subunit 2